MLIYWNAACILPTKLEVIISLDWKIIFFIASGLEIPWPINTGAFTPRTGLPP